MADTGITVWAPGFWADDVWAVGLWANTPPVTVPDVVGQTQAAGTAILEGDGFVVAVVTAYSSVVPAGTIISQAPTAGSLAALGSTVTITVSLGDAPIPPTPDGGGGPDKSDSRDGEYWYWLERARKQIAEQAQKRAAIREDAERIPDATTREISVLLRKQAAKDEARKELAALQQFADSAAKAKAAIPNQKLAELINSAATARTNTALLTLQREMARIDEEEEALVIALLLMN